jgi:hypothetical protein
MGLQIQDFSPFVDMTEGEFFDYFKDKCTIGTPIKAIYREEQKKYQKSVRRIKKDNGQRKESKSDTITD